MPELEPARRADMKNRGVIAAAVVAGGPQTADVAIEVDRHHGRMAARYRRDALKRLCRVVESIPIDGAVQLHADEEQPVAVVRIVARVVSRARRFVEESV